MKNLIRRLLEIDAAAWLVSSGSKQIRRLPAVVVRVLCMIDFFFCFHPIWGFFAYRRWSGRRVSVGEFAPIYARGVRFVIQHLAHTGEGTGPFALSWFSEPVRRSPATERADWATPGSCGTCKNCCSTNWLPEESRMYCPFLGEKGCQVYGSVWWDYFNCGRYPAENMLAAVYACERFGDTPAAAPKKLPMLPARPARELVGS